MGGIGEKRSVQCYLGRPERKKPFGRTGHRYDEIIKTDFQEIKWSKKIDWIGLSGQLMGCCENGNEQLGLQNEGNFLTSSAVSQLLTAQQAVYPHTTKCIIVL